MINHNEYSSNLPELPSPGKGNKGTPNIAADTQIYELRIGETGFISPNSIIFDLKRKLYIDPFDWVEPLQNLEYSLPIERVGELAGDYDFNFEEDMNETVYDLVHCIASYSKDIDIILIPQYLSMTLKEYFEIYQEENFDEQIKDFEIIRRNNKLLPFPKPPITKPNNLERKTLTISYNFSHRKSPPTYDKKYELMERIENGEYECIPEYVKLFDKLQEPLEIELRKKLFEIYIMSEEK